MNRSPPLLIRGPVLITGCSSGVGRAAAALFRRAGFETFATARQLSAMEDLRAIGCRTLQLDVTDDDARRAAVEAVEADFGAIGVLVNNAGYGQYGPLEDISLDALRRQFETNVFGGLRLAQLALPGMRRAGGGRIVNVSSVAGRVSVAGGGAYHASKFALEALADALRPEVAPFGVEVVNVLPGPIATQFEARLLKSISELEGDDLYAPFKRNLARRMHGFLAKGGFGVMSAEHVAKIIFKAATTPHPRPRYSVGLIARFGPLARALTPDRLVDRLMRLAIPNSE
ncbi:short-chain dehydrogenase/reductase SDR [Methylocella silvestris BL2]|uniref:Short-chain dehydrogenase/reductase SDR n=1 Tax=Methylocella silvestris (strain DSM 15510 / CIP 108128 / LMG 27833 / NCIMB 13906 / BL2) TaxID=395965 RepID=B8EQ14_METSB|nr:SDR family NAD(P)-dependent oxidoreductase [Methylocella silvestris]ACK51504.1 short-chain dehydrogenase/reductase SDR [Methylocella silvestris BL2]